MWGKSLDIQVWRSEEKSGLEINGGKCGAVGIQMIFKAKGWL